MRPGDSLTLASDSSERSIRYCLVPNVDDFEQIDTQDACGTPGYPSQYTYVDVAEGKFRRTMEWTEAAGPGFLLVHPGCGACSTDVWVYTVTIEQLTTRVNIGLPKVEPSTRHIAVNASATLGDNSQAPDGIAGQLYWRPRSGDVQDLQLLASATTLGGQLAFEGTLPSAAGGSEIQLVACVDQIGGGEQQCAKQRVKVPADKKPSIKRRRGKMTRVGVVRLPLRCSQEVAPASCDGSIRLKARGLRSPRKRFSILGGEVSRVPIRLNNRFATQVRNHGPLQAKAIVKLKGQAGRRITHIRLTT
jgi:hypothetical protein